MLHQLNIIIHVTAGTLALLIGIIPYASKKGEAIHIRFGRIFLGLMAVVVITALLGVLFFRDRPFLTLITVQSFYMATSGFRALKYKTNGPSQVDFGLTLVLLGAAGVFIWGLQDANVVWHTSVIVYLLVFLLMVGCYDLLRFFRVLNWPNAWIHEHYLKMTSAYSALFSAGMGTLMVDMEPYSQIVPSVMGTLLLIGVIWRFGRRSKVVAQGACS